MPTDRAGYNLSVFCIDVSPSMGDMIAVGDDGEKRSKLDLVKEYVARRCEPRISSGRKTEAVGVLTYGGRTNNQAHQAFAKNNPDDADPPYAHVACDVAIQTAKPKTLEEVMNLSIGTQEGNPVSALMVALDMVYVHKHTKSWSLEVVLLTDGESGFDQGEYEDLMRRFEEMAVRLVVLGIGFEPIGVPTDKSKPRPKRLSEKFWRTFVEQLHDRFAGVTQSDDFYPSLEVFEDALVSARMPVPATVNGTVSGIDLLIGSEAENPGEAIRIPVKYSKATMKARPPTLSRAWKPAMDLQQPLAPGSHRPLPSAANHMLSTYVESQSASQHKGPNPPTQSDIAAMISSDVKGYSTYVIKKEAAQAPAPSQDAQAETQQSFPAPTQDVAMDEEEETVDKEDLVKAWRFGSTWVPVESDTFEPLATRKGVEVLGFFPRANLKRHHLMGEVRFVWPDLADPKAQIQFSSLVAAMMLREMVAVVRWVLKDQAEPVIGVCIPEQDFPGDDKRLDFMFWVKLPFAEDEHNFWFPSLTTYKTAAGKVVTEHSLLPTDEQCDLMEEFVQANDLSTMVEGDVDDEDSAPEPWFDTVRSFNPAIHRIKEAIFHASLTLDLDKDPLGPPHPDITKYFAAPDDLVKRSETVTEKLKSALDIKKVPAKVRMQKRQKEGLRDDEGYIDIDELFDGPEDKAGPSGKAEPVTPRKANTKDEPMNDGAGADDDDDDFVSPAKSQAKPKPKRGRLISNEDPFEDFNRVIGGEGDVFKKAILDLGAVVKENVEASFSRQAFPLAIECLHAMRQTALTYEEVETYNEYFAGLEEFVNAPKFKHKDFWKVVEKEGEALGEISPEEEEAALQ